jgi:hypothetical protein
MDSLFRQPARCVFKDWDEVRSDMMGVEDGWTRLKGRGNPFLESHGVMKDRKRRK